MEENSEAAPAGQGHPFTQASLSPQRVENPRHRARILAAIAGFPLGAVNLFDDLDGDEDVILLKTEERVGIVEQDVCVEDVVFDQARRAPPCAVVRPDQHTPWMLHFIR